MSLLVSISTWFLTLFRSPSIKKKIRTSHIIIIVSMLAAPVTSIMVSLFQTVRYDQIITNVSKTNQLNQIVKTSITNEIWNIVAGNKKFGEADQYEILKSIRKQLEDIKRTTQVVKNRQMLEVAGRAVNTLGNYIDRLGEQKRNHFPVSENEIILDEIRGVSALISDILQDFIVLEIESAAKTNESIKRTAWGLSLLQLVIVFLVTLFAVFAQRSVAQSINQPITELENLSTRIASGDLSARAELPNVTELDNLTENLNLMAQKIRKLLDENILEQKNLQKSEMNALQAQITPHFLYNTFDTIIWLAEAQRYDQVIDITRAFSNFFRISLNKGKDWIPVREEFEHIHSYLTIQKIRYRDILDYTIHFDEDMADESVLKLLLQPLVENALYHGIKNKRGKGLLSVRGWRESGFLCFSVEDNGIGMTEERLLDINLQLSESLDPSMLSSVYGLYNVNKRLELYYNQNSRLEISSTYKEGTRVFFKVPKGEKNV